MSSTYASLSSRLKLLVRRFRLKVGQSPQICTLLKRGVLTILFCLLSHVIFSAIVGDGSTSQEELLFSRMNFVDSSKNRNYRTSKRPYNVLKKNEKYFMYTASGGFTNQLYCLMSGMYVAKITGRALVIPPLGKHSDFYTGYIKLENDDLVPFDEILDFEAIEKSFGVKLVPLNVSLRKFNEKYLGEQSFQKSKYRFTLSGSTRLKPLRTSSHAYQDGILQALTKIKDDVVFYFGPFYTKYYTDLGNIKEHLAFSPFIKNAAQTIALKVFDNQPFNAMHIRLGDYKKLAKSKSKDASAYLTMALQIGFSVEAPVYLATDEVEDLYFSPLYEVFERIVRERDAREDPTVEMIFTKIDERFPNVGLRNTIMGIIEQHICAIAEKYVGSKISTFSNIILHYRKNLDKIAPEVLKLPSYNADARVDGVTSFGGN